MKNFAKFAITNPVIDFCRRTTKNADPFSYNFHDLKKKT